MTDTATSNSDEPVIRLDRLDEAGQSILFTEARTAYKFDREPVSDEELKSIWDLAKWPPTTANMQPLRVLYVQSPEARKKLIGFMAEGNRDKTASAPAVAVLAIDTEFHEHANTVMPTAPQYGEMFAKNEEARLKVAQFSGALQSGYFILAARARGLATGPMGGFDGPAIDAEFFPGGRYKTVLVVNLGHPATDAHFPRQPRLDDDTVITFA